MEVLIYFYNGANPCGERTGFRLRDMNSYFSQILSQLTGCRFFTQVLFYFFMKLLYNRKSFGKAGYVMDLKRLLSYTRQAVDDYGLIEEHDTIAVGLSGGKDSLALLYALKSLRRFYPRRFDLVAITVHQGFEGFDTKRLGEFCEALNVPYEIVNMQIAEIVFGIKKLEHPCSLCAKLRKGAFNQAALACGCNKTAFAHHRDDFVETMLLSLFYEGRFHSFSPKTELERTGLTLIRPFLYVPEAGLNSFQRKYELPVVKNPCPADGHTRRQYVKELIRTLQREHPHIRERMFSAILSASFDDWPLKTDHQSVSESCLP